MRRAMALGLALFTSCSSYDKVYDEFCRTPPSDINERNFANQVRNLSPFQVIASITVPRLAIRYVTEYLKKTTDSDAWEKEEYVASFTEIHRNGKDDCDGGAVAAAVILGRQGYGCNFLWTEGQATGHLVYLYPIGLDGSYGVISILKDECNEEPQTLEEIAKKICEKHGHFKYAIFNADHLWREMAFGKGNISSLSELIRKSSLRLVGK